MSCGCNKPKCGGGCGISPAVLQINNRECIWFHRVDVPASQGDSKTNPPKNGAYRNTLLYYEADEEAFFYSTDGIPTRLTRSASDYNMLINKPSINGVVLIGDKSLDDLGITGAIANAVAEEAHAREETDQAIFDEIEEIKSASDVVDVVGTYAALESYDTSTLNDNDILKVLQDETHNGATTYYRWNENTSSFSYVGEVGPYYTKDEIDALLRAKQDSLETLGYSDVELTIENIDKTATTAFVIAKISQNRSRASEPELDAEKEER